MVTYVCSADKHSCSQVKREVAQFLQKGMLSSRIARQESNSAEAKVVNGMCDACYK